MIRIITFGDLKIWLFIEQIHAYRDDDLVDIHEMEEYLCYFKFSEPTVIVYGELIRENGNKAPKVFKSIEEAEQFSTEYLQSRFHFKK
jgi:hypothetical protein